MLIRNKAFQAVRISLWIMVQITIMWGFTTHASAQISVEESDDRNMQEFRDSLQDFDETSIWENLGYCIEYAYNTLLTNESNCNDEEIACLRFPYYLNGERCRFEGRQCRARARTLYERQLADCAEASERSSTSPEQDYPPEYNECRLGCHYQRSTDQRYCEASLQRYFVTNWQKHCYIDMRLDFRQCLAQCVINHGPIDTF